MVPESSASTYEENPIYRQYFANSAFITSKTFDNPRSVLFRKHLALWRLLSDTKPSSVPTAALVERSGDNCLHHVLWLRDEGLALRESSSWREGRRGAAWTAKNERSVRDYLNRIYKTMAGLRSKFLRA